MYEWDQRKNALNIAKHGVDFDDVYAFEWEHATFRRDLRSDYGEPRFIAESFVFERLHVLVFARRGGKIRVISLRKANTRERKRYEQDQKLH